MTTYDTSYISSLIESDRVHRSVYTDPEIFDLEMERVWGHSWVYIGHDSQVKKPGDYYATTLGKQPVVMTRHKDGNVHVLYNRCAHKGALVVGDTAGNAKALRCAYHGWVYDTDGTVLTIPLEEGYDKQQFGRAHPCARMMPVPRVDSYRGLVFASLAAEGPALKTWLGGVASSIDNLADRSPEGELEVAGGCLRYSHDSNWKMFVENLNDALHPVVVHQSSAGTALQVCKSELKKDEPVPAELEILGPFAQKYSFFDEMGATACENGHSFMGGRFSIHTDYSPIPGYTDKLEDAYGKDRTAEILSLNRHNTVVYPSFTLKGAIQSVRVVRPISVNKTIIESWVLKLKGAPEEMFQRSILYSNLINSQANLVGPDDWEAYHRVQNGLATDNGNEWVSLHRYLGEDETNDDGTSSGVGSSDLVFRNQYAAWKGYMTNGGGQQP